MHKIEYEIKINKTGRPYIDFPKDYEDKAEDKFFVMELTRYLLQNVYNRRSVEFDNKTADTIDISIKLIGQVSDEIAVLLYNQMETMGEVDMMLDKRYHIEVTSFEELNKLSDIIVWNNKLFKKQDGLKAIVGEERNIYEFNGDNWEVAVAL